jgi:RNA polymerase sigma-70 factor (ECF subfamily)
VIPDAHPPAPQPASSDPFAAGRAAWPALSVEPARFARMIAAALDAGADVSSVHAGDLYLAAACASGEDAAIRAFDAHFAPDIPRALQKLGLRGAEVDEVQQSLRSRLFVADAGSEPKIASYSGRGPLRAWLRALVAHEAMSEHRRRARTRHETDSALGELAADDDPELAEVRARYAGPFREAFAEALAALSPRDRNVLRLVYTDGLAVDEVARVYDVHRVSVSRWLGQIRKDLLDGTRALLRARLALDDAELASLTRLCLSRIDVSLDRLLSG